MLPSSNELNYFYEVAIELHFSRAAKKLNVTQPSLSLAIKRLEDTLGTSLFIRHTKGVALTRAGKELFNDVKKLLTMWEETVTNLKNMHQLIKGQVIIGCHSTLTPFMSNMTSSLLKQHPGLEIHFQHDLTPKILENILQGKIDIGITIDPYPHANLILQKIADGEFAFWVSNKHSAEIDIFAEDTVFICDPQLSQTQYLLKELQKNRNSDRLRLTTMNQLESIAAMTADSNCVGILPSGFTKRYFGDKLVKVTNAPVYLKPICLSYRSDNKDVMAIQVVLNAIKNLARELSLNECNYSDNKQ